MRHKKVSEFFGYPGIAITHMMALSGVLFAKPMNWILIEFQGLTKLMQMLKV